MAIVTKRRPGEYFDELEIMPPAEREVYLNQKLAQTIEIGYYRAPAIKTLFDRARLGPDDIKTVKDLEKLPITRKNDLIELQKSNPPYGGFLTVPSDSIERVFISPGPLYEPLQHSGIKWFAKAFWAAGFRKGDVVINTFTYHMSPAGILMHESLRDCGTTVIPIGTGNTDIQIETIRHLGVTGYIGTPSFLMTIIKRTEELGYNFRQAFALSKAWFTGEMLAPSVRKVLEEDYRIATAQAYAVTEPGGAIAYECRQKNGMHLMDDYIVEIVDPQTGKQTAPGLPGEIVVTPVHNKTWALIRFGTGDISSLIVESCECGRTARRLGPLIGRTGDAVKVRGMFIVGKQANQILHSFDNIARYQLVITRKGQRDELELKMELKQDIADRNALTTAINHIFQNNCRVHIDRFEIVQKDVLPADVKPILDKRKWD